MNRFILQGFISSIKYQQNNVFVFVDDFKAGHKKSNGETVDDKYRSWKIIFPDGMKSFINKYFGNGMLVDIVAEMLPYEINHEKIVDGYSCLGLSIQKASYPRATVKQEQRMVKDSQLHASGTPDLEEFNRPDF